MTKGDDEEEEVENYVNVVGAARHGRKRFKSV